MGSHLFLFSIFNGQRLKFALRLRVGWLVVCECSLRVPVFSFFFFFLPCMRSAVEERDVAHCACVSVIT